MTGIVELAGRLRWLVFVPLLVASGRPDLYLIALKGTGPSSRLVGTAKLTPARSPFGVATTKDGQFVFTVEVDVPLLPPPTTFGAAPDDLRRVDCLGPARPDRADRRPDARDGAPRAGRHSEVHGGDHGRA